MKRATWREIIYLNTYWIGLSFMWNSLHVIILPAVLLHLVPETQKNTYLGLLTFLGLVIAMLVQPVSGALSDRWTSRWGRRRPLILLGTSFDFLFLAVLGWAGGLWWLALGYIGLQFSSNIAHGPMQGLLPDRIPRGQLGAASGVKNLMDMLGLVASSLVMGRLVSPDVRQPVTAVLLISLILAAGLFVTLIGTREKPSNSAAITSSPMPGVTPGQPDPPYDKQKTRSFAWLIAARFAFLFGIYDIQVFAQYYVRDVYSVPNPVQLTGDLLAAITLTLIVFALGGGWLSDRIGHKRVSVLSSLLGATGCLLMLWSRTPITLLLYGSILGAGIGLFLTSNWAMANQLAPLTEAGKYLGLTNLATAGAGATGRLLGPFIDILNNLRPEAFWGYQMLFILGAVCILISAMLLRMVTALDKPALKPQPSTVDI